MMRIVVFLFLLVLGCYSLPFQVKVQYCVSCGYEQTFTDLEKNIRRMHEDAEIIGENYVPSEIIGYLAQFIDYGKLILIIAIMSNSFANSTNDFLRYLNLNKITSCAMIYSTGVLLVQFIMSSGAFEIYVNDELIWSKLEKGDIPDMETMLVMITNSI